MPNKTDICTNECTDGRTLSPPYSSPNTKVSPVTLPANRPIQDVRTDTHARKDMSKVKLESGNDAPGRKHFRNTKKERTNHLSESLRRVQKGKVTRAICIFPSDVTIPTNGNRNY